MVDLLVILGAGASFDALRSDQERPPLANQLFDTTHDDIQRQFPAVDRLRDTIQARMSGKTTIENILGTFAASPSQDIQAQVFQIPVYLKALMGRFSAARPGIYDRLITLVQERELTVMFVTLNYDTLLDEAIERAYSVDTPIATIQSYVASGEARNWHYVKLHGSVNWGYRTSIFRNAEMEWAPGQPAPDLAMEEYLSTIETYRQYGRQMGSSESYRDIVLLPDNDALLSDGVFVYPALAIPTDQKSEAICPPEHVAALHEALQSDPAVLVIGNQGLDTDLMALLRESAVEGSSKPFFVVDPDESGQPRSRFAKALGRSRFTIQGSHEFREFVESGRANRFLNEVRAASAERAHSPYRL